MKRRLAMILMLQGASHCGESQAVFQEMNKVRCPTHDMRPHVTPTLVCQDDVFDAPHAALAAKTQVFALQFAVRDDAALDAHLAHLALPNPQGRKPHTLASFLAAHGPLAHQVTAAKRVLAQAGLEVVGQQGLQMLVRGTARQLAEVLSVSLTGHADGAGNPFLGTEAPSAMLGTLEVTWMQPLSGPAPARTHLTQADIDAPGFGPGEIRAAYEVPDHMTGAGRKVGILTLAPYDPADIRAYAAAFEIREVPRTDVRVAGYDGVPTGDPDELETTMDIQLANGMAPDLAEIRVYMGRNQDLLQVVNAAANDPDPITMLSLSWGAPENRVSLARARAMYDLLRQLAAQGQTLFVASGDDGALGDKTHVVTDDPASQPFAVAVGGTSLMTDRHGRWAKEVAWSGSGGGLSCFWPLPSWQRHLIVEGPETRKVPDVALVADAKTGHVIYWKGQHGLVGGTSAAAPLWAAFGALIEQRRHGLPALGYLAPHLYRVAKHAVTRDAFRDIQKGSNGVYSSLPGFDEVTGWGSFHGAKLLDAMGAIP